MSLSIFTNLDHIVLCWLNPKISWWPWQGDKAGLNEVAIEGVVDWAARWSLSFLFGFLWWQSILYFHTQRDIVQQCTMPEKYRTMCNVLQESKDENLKTSLRRVNSFFSGTATSSLECQSTSYSDRYCLRKQFWWIMVMPADGGKVDTILLGACQLLEHL